MCTCICVLQKAEQVSCRFFHFPGGSWAPGMPQRFWARTLLRVHSCQIFVDKFPSILHLRWNSLCGCFFFRPKIYQLLTQWYQRTWSEVHGRFGFEGFRKFWKVQTYWRFRSLEGFGTFENFRRVFEVWSLFIRFWRVLKGFGGSGSIWKV